MKYEPRKWEQVSVCIREAIAKASELHRRTGVKTRVRFTFNEVRIVVDHLSDRDLIYRDYLRAIKGCLGDEPEIGPRTKTLTSKTRQRDELMAQRRQQNPLMPLLDSANA